MKTLYLMRHADAPGAFELQDKERPLSPHGIKQAKSIAPHLSNIEYVLCSGAVRTKMTCAALIEGGAEFDKIDYEDRLYNAPEEILLREIQNTEETGSILLIAHNPGIYALVNQLIGAATEKFETVRFSYSPATLSIIHCPIDQWADLRPHKNELADLIIPE